MNGGNVSLENFYQIFDADWYSQIVEAEIHYKSGEDEMKLSFLVKELLSLYFQEKYNDVKGTEIPIVVPLIDPSNGKNLGLNLEDFIDLVEENDTIVEFKASVQTMKQKDNDEFLQITAYCYAYEIFCQKPPKLIKVVDFVKTKKPNMITLWSTRNKTHY